MKRKCNGGEHLQHPEGQRFKPYLAPSAAAFFIDGFLGPGTGTAWWLVFSWCHDRGKDVISWWPLPRPFFVFWSFQHVVFHFFGGMVSAALWFFDSLIFCSGALIGYISSFHSFSSFLLVGRRGCWCSDKSLFHFFGDESSSEIAL